ncbi:MFS general substrate transporter [Dissoconium aciculare CBS 342.82]|uniref:Cercosporin MFS transporter CTB4 n=1 Tax=Dissoconium aciculare CBS 342.82 TaxID=1314786 RepID=A0A6J3MGY2_9PEZI|nr:MFS general substrate transporter [Dissoconium aciculare CBS 342.82]KAF1826157.1 MFS general substrate transporter [Dissoconium aciculare CBS 342.82]
MTLGHSLERALSRPTAKPYRTRNVQNEQFHVNQQGHLTFSPGDIENPKEWSTGRRWYITLVAVLITVNATFASSGPSGCLLSIADEFQVSEEAAGLVTTLFLLGYCFGPLVWAPLSEFYGRRYIFYSTFFLYFVFNFLCAFTPSFAGLLVGRFLTGTLASAGLSNSPGVLADLWGAVERGNAFALFSVCTFAGPALSPIISGFFQLTLNWRWSFYVLIWLAFPTLLLMLTIPETLPSQVLLNKAKRLRRAKVPGYEKIIAPVEASDRSLMGIFKVALIRPWIILLDPIALLTAIYLSIVYALLYMEFTIYPVVFQQKRGWNSGVGQLPLLGAMVGAILGGVIVYFDSRRNRRRMLEGIELTPEGRLPLAMFAGVLFPVTMFWFAWTGEFDSIHWIVPTLAGVFLNTAVMLIFVCYLNYLTDTYLMYAASALAGNTIARSAMAAAAPLYTQQMFSALGVGVAGSIIGAVACLLAVIPFLFYRYGARIRQKSRFAPTDDSPAPDSGSGAGIPSTTEEQEHSSESDAERGLDEVAGVADGLEQEEHLEKKESRGSRGGDPYLNADGMEKAER